MKAQRPQLALRLGPEAPDRAEPEAERWRDGAPLTYLGERISLRLDTDRKQALLEDGVLHLPLPPQARPRQIRDAAEAWLRAEATALFRRIAARQGAELGRPAPHIALSFSTRSDWVLHADGNLRCNWRLIEQPRDVIATALGRAIAAMPMPMVEIDLFAALA